MSTCSRCGASFDCAMADQLDAPCWCVALPAVVPVPGVDASCWCPVCLKRHIAAQQGDADAQSAGASGND